MMTAAIYARVSTPRQSKNGYSIDGQIVALRNYAVKHNLRLIDEFSDQGLSGKDMQRSGLRQVISLVKEHQIERLLVWRLNRLSRDVNDLLTIFRVCDENNVEIISLNEPTQGNDATGRLQRSIFAIIGELERQLIADNQAIAFKQKVREGKVLSSQLPLGYKWVNDQVVVDDQAAEVVRFIFNCYTEKNLGYRRIMQQINKQGHRNYSEARLKSIITNQRYAGIMVTNYGVSKKVFPVIIKKQQFEKAQGIRINRHIVKKYDRECFLLKTLECPYCGHHLSPQHVKNSGKLYFYYACVFCSKPSFRVRSGSIETEVVNKLFTLLTSPHIQRKLAEMNTANQRLLKQSRLVKQQQQDQLLKQFESGQINVSQLKQKSTVNEKGLNSAPKLPKGMLPSKAISILQSATTRQRMLVMQYLVGRVTFSKNKKVMGVFLNSAPTINILKLSRETKPC